MSTWFKAAPSMSWVRDRTIVRCYDADGHETAILDGSTGLRWHMDVREDGTYLTVDDSMFPSGPWVFDGVFMTGGNDGPLVSTAVHTEGVSISDGIDYAQLVDYWNADPDSPWDYPGQAVFFTLFAEREERLGVCHACVNYDHLTGVCAVDGNFMPAKTVNAGEVCPVGKWVQPTWWSQEAADARMLAAAPPTPITPEDQIAFEAEWEARNAG